MVRAVSRHPAGSDTLASGHGQLRHAQPSQGASLTHSLPTRFGEEPLIKAVGLAEVVPLIQYDWKKPFRIPWL